MGDVTNTALINAGAQLAGTSINAASAAQTNKKQRQWAEERYNVQRKDALADYAQQNLYNSPAAQMQRLKEAGLNPNLVYGNGATAEGGQIRQSNTPNYNPQAPQIDLAPVGNSLMQMYDAQVKQATYDNLKVQKTVMLEEAKLKAAQTLNVLTQGESQKFDLNLKSDLRQTTVQAAAANLNNLLASNEKTKADTQYTTDQNRRQNELQPYALKTQMQNLIMGTLQQAKTQNETREIQQRVNNLLRDQTLKEIEIEIRRRGGNPNDPYWQKKLQQLVEGVSSGKIESKPPAKGVTGWLDRLSPY